MVISSCVLQPFCLLSLLIDVTFSLVLNIHVYF